MADDIDAATDALELADATPPEQVDPNEDPTGRYIEWTQKDGEVAHWRLADEIGVIPLMMFARQANNGMDSNDLGALEVMFQLLQDCIHPDVFRRFINWGTQQKLQPDDIFQIVQLAWEAISGDPSGSASGSSPGSSTTSPSSNGTSGNRASRRSRGKGQQRARKDDPQAELKRSLGIVPITAEGLAEGL
jgi:hypothetical protein